MNVHAIRETKVKHIGDIGPKVASIAGVVVRVAGGEESTSREAERKLKPYNHVHLPTPNLIYI